MYRVGINVKRITLLIGDMLVFELSLTGTLLLRYGAVTSQNWSLHVIPFTIINFLWVIGLYVAGLYELSIATNDIRFFRKFLEGMIGNLVIAFAFFYLIPVFGIAPRTNLFLYFAIALLLGYGWRLAYNRTITGAFFKNRLLFIGRATDAAKIRALLKSSALGFELISILETDKDEHFQEEGLTWYTHVNDLPSIIEKNRINTILIGQEPESVLGLRDALYRTIFSQVTLLDRTELEEILTGRVPLEYVSQTWFLEHLRESEKAWYDAVKRITDIIISIPFIVLTIVLYPFIALAIKVSSRGTILYSHTRIGKMGKPFKIWKFRTMLQDAETAGKPQWATKDDPRVTGVGAFLRKTRLDELPQIFNVLRGEMSLIGPRPERPQFVEQLTEQMPYYALRHLTRPGLTGWAQVKFPYAGTVEDNLKKLQYDLYYIKHRSAFLDAAILLKTIGIVLRRQGT